MRSLAGLVLCECESRNPSRNPKPLPLSPEERSKDRFRRGERLWSLGFTFRRAVRGSCDKGQLGV